MPRELNLDVKRPKDGKTSAPYIDITQLALDLMKHGAEMYFGTMTGTGASLDSPTLPFDPAAVIIINQTRASMGIKLPTMADDDTLKTVTAGTTTYDAAGGIALGTKKFTIGTDADFNTAADVIHFVAFGARDVGGSR